LSSAGSPAPPAAALELPGAATAPMAPSVM